MPDSDDELEQNFRSATRDVRGAPVRWPRIQRRVRYRRIAALIGLAASLLLITIILTTGLVAGKKAVDPTYHPPLIFGTGTQVDFDEEGALRGHTLLGDYLRATRLSSLGIRRAALREEGFVFRSDLRLAGFRGHPLRINWRLRRAASGPPLAVRTYAAPRATTPESDRLTTDVRVWMSYPRRAGRYVVDMELRNSSGEIVSTATSEPLKVAAPRVSTPYRTPGYESLLPAGWRFERRYERASKRRFVTEMVGPDGLRVLIDTTRATTGDAAESARTLERALRGQPGYRRIRFHWILLRGQSVFEWSFLLNGRRKTDILFYRGRDGFGVLASGPRDRSDEVREVARQIVRSIRARG